MIVPDKFVIKLQKLCVDKICKLYSVTSAGFVFVWQIFQSVLTLHKNDNSYCSSTFGHVCWRTPFSQSINLDVSHSLWGADWNPAQSSEQKCGVTGASIIINTAKVFSNSLLLAITSGGILFYNQKEKRYINFNNVKPNSYTETDILIIFIKALHWKHD